VLQIGLVCNTQASVSLKDHPCLTHSSPSPQDEKFQITDSKPPPYRHHNRQYTYSHVLFPNRHHKRHTHTPANLLFKSTNGFLAHHTKHDHGASSRPPCNIPLTRPNQSSPPIRQASRSLGRACHLHHKRLRPPSHDQNPYSS